MNAREALTETVSSPCPGVSEMAAAVTRAIEETGFSGVITVDAGSDRLFAAVSGMAHRASGVPNTLETRFGIASGSKAFTALAVMRLVEEGVLDLDEPIRGLLGAELPQLDPGLTIRQLLAHRGGIGDYIADGEVTDHVLTVPVHTLTSAEAFLPALSELRQEAAPGERFAYANAGYIILAILLERASGEVFHDLIRELVLVPAGLHDTDYLRLDALPERTAVGYLGETGHRANTLHLPVLGNGDGGAHATAADLHRFWSALFAGKIVTPASRDLLLEPRSDVPEEDMRHASGFWRHRTGEEVILEGCDAGVSFRTAHDPRTATTITVVANTAEGAWPVARAAFPG